ncbi:MAG TPA: tetratricopeptide repeat protein [Pricia sp.]|nr:tetratricopeptide repeat protein [Pricia sp.]
MQKKRSIRYFLTGLLLGPFLSPAQEDPAPEFDVEQSAKVFLEAYSDEFQENFFEALKQKGIENYDKAVNFLLKCKQLDASKRVVDHELAKVYFEIRQYPLAEEYALTAVNSEPGNYWYAETLVRILQKQGKSVENMASEIPFGHPEFDENLARIYFKKGNYETALAILKKVKKSTFTEVLTSKINDSIEKREARIASTPVASDQTETGPNALEVYKMRMAALLRAQSFPTLQQLAEEALESYPSQPYFYYVLGHALNQRGKAQQAVEPLETALDYLIDDGALANKIYQELADAYTALDNPVKANTYLRKIEPGF